MFAEGSYHGDDGYRDRGSPMAPCHAFGCLYRAGLASLAILPLKAEALRERALYWTESSSGGARKGVETQLKTGAGTEADEEVGVDERER